MIKTYRKKFGFSLIELIIVLVILLILVEMSSPNHRYGGHRGSWKLCMSNQRRILLAIEMYDMDHIERFRELNDEVIELLVKENYLKEKESDYKCPEKEGKYHSLGNIYKSGVLYCEKHGTIDEIEIKPGMSFMDYVDERERKEKEKIKKSLKYAENDIIRQLCRTGLILSILGCVLVKIYNFQNKKLKK